MSADAVPIEELLVHLGWVRALAFRLVGREAEADDIVQRTFEAALRAPPIERRAVKGWLRRVVKNAVAERRRADRRRERREVAAAAPEASVSDVSDIAARVELQRAVVAAVQQLPQHYRATVHLRYFGGLSRERMAAELGVSEEAVKSRLARAIDMLRADLKRRFGVDDAGLELALLPLLSWPSPGPLLPADDSHAKPAKRASARRAAVAAALTVALVAALAVSHRLLTAPVAPGGSAESADVDPRPATSAVPRRHPSEPADDPVPPPSDDPPPPESESVSDPLTEPEAFGRRVTRVTLLGWTEELGDVPLRVVPRHARMARKSPERTVVAHGGVALLDAELLAPPDGMPVLYVVTVDHPELVPLTSDVLAGLHPERATEAQVELVRATKLRGAVAGPDGAPAAGARVAVVRRLVTSERCVEVDSCDVAPDGRFELRADPSSPGYVIAAAVPFRVDSIAFSRAAELATAPLALRLTEAESVAGRIEYDTPGPGCLSVELQYDGVEYGAGIAAVPVGWRDGRFELTEQTAVVRPDGTFELAGVAPGRVRARAFGRALSFGSLRAFRATTTVPGEPLLFRIPGIPLRVRVREGGQPVARTLVTVSGDHGAGSADTDDAGVAEFRVEAGVPLTVKVRDRAPQFRHEFTPSEYAGEPEEVAIDLTPEPVFEWRVRLLGPDGSPVQAASATFTPRGALRDVLRSRLGTYDAAGRVLVFHDIPAGDYAVEIGAGEAVHDPTLPLTLGRTEVTIPVSADHVAEISLRSGGRLVVLAGDRHGEMASIRGASLVPESGAPVPVEFVRRGAGDLASPNLGLAGWYDVYPVLPAGAYRLVVQRWERDAVECSVVITDGDTTVVHVELPD